jgi:release factor glutamine methyltransferase
LSTIQDLYLRGKILLKKVPNPSLEAKIILLKSLGISEESFYTSSNRSLSRPQKLTYLRMISKRIKGMPLAYVIEEKEFWSIPFRVCPGVLIPRPETELLVEKVLEHSSRRKELIVDLGTGSGNVAVSLAKELSQAEIVATDVSEKALDVASANAARQKISSIRFEKGSLFEPLEKPGLQKKCDILVSNPPYVSESEWQTLPDDVCIYEPKEALVAGPTGLEFISRLIKGAPAFLKPRGYLCLEIGYGQKQKALSLFDDDWNSVRCFDDLSGIPRVIAAQL